MKKLSKAQEKSMIEAILNDYRQHRFDFSDKKAGLAFNHSATQATCIALAKVDLADGIEIFGNRRTIYKLRLSDTGRKVAIDLLHEGAVEEMESDLKYRDMEMKRLMATGTMAAKIIANYGVGTVEVTADYRLRDNMTLCYAIGFPQEFDHRYSSPLVRIDWSRGAYTIGTTGTHLTPKDAKRMGELMLIAVQVIESGILS